MKQLAATLAIVALAACAPEQSAFDGTMEESASIRTSETLFNRFGGNVRRLLRCATKAQKPVIVAHRGGFAPGFPENSLAAIERSVNNAPVIIEVDIVSTSDGVEFLHHDQRLERTTTGTGDVNAAAWSEIGALSMRDNSTTQTGYTPTRFDEFLETLRGRAFLMLDLKSPVDTAALVHKVADARMIEATIMIAYSHDQARQLRSADHRALIALGAERMEQFEAARSAGLLDEPIVALTGPISLTSDVAAAFKDHGHFILAGSYLGENPPDARLETDERVPEFDEAGRSGYSLLVSNRPLLAASYLRRQGLQIDADTCDQER